MSTVPQTLVDLVHELTCHVEDPPQVGVLRDVTKRQGQVPIEYELQKIEPLLSAEDLAEPSQSP